MSILTKSQIAELNDRMLGLGAPVERDDQGYNQVDYNKMYFLAEKSDLTDNEACIVVTTLLKYTRTQLIQFADSIKETIKHYQAVVKEVRVVGYTEKSVKLSWNFNKSVSEQIKTMDKTQFRWTKPNGQWVLDVNWGYLKNLVEVFQENGFFTNSVEYIEKHLEELLDKQPKTEVKEEKPEEIKLQVERPINSIDTLVLKVPYNAKVVKAFKSVPDMFFNSSDKSWECYIENALTLYNELENAQVEGLDMSQLKPWSELVDNWGKSYELIDWTKCPLKFKPYDFQIEDAKMLLSQKVMLNANDMGCGKTFEQILVGESIPMKKLVVCPPTLRINWKKEIENVNPNANINILYSADDFKVVDGWNIIGYNSLDKFQKQLEEEKFQVVMVDEAHYIQAVSNSGKPDSKRAYGVLRLAATANYVYPITGTPKTNRNKNLFNILRTIRHDLTRSKWAFSNYGRVYCAGYNEGWGWNYDGNSNDEELNEKLKPFMVRHLKSEVLPHLKKQRIVTPVEVDLREYHYEINEYLKNRTNKNAQDLARLMRARKILAVQKVGESVDFAKNLIMEGKKVVIVTCFTEVVKAVVKAFKDNVVKLVGGMTDEAKDKAIIEFQNGEAQVMVMNIVAGGVGVTLTKSYNMVINDFDWTPGNLTQAEDRICRSGQTEEYCNIYYLYASGADMDEVFVDTLTNKFSTINAVVDGGTGDQIDYLDLINKALEKSTGIKKVRRMVKVEDEQADNKPVQPTKATKDNQVSYKGKTLDELIEIAKNVGAVCKVYDNEAIYKMRLVMAIKKQMQA